MREISTYAPAKINLYLDVLDKRQDGFHNIETVFEKIDLKDELIIKEKGKGLNVRVDTKDCPSGKNNLVDKAINSLFIEAGVRLNLDIHIKKRIPLSAGLGGGSSDAVSALCAVNEAFRLGISRKRLFSIGSDIGKDCAFFMQDNSFAIGRGAGDLLEPIKLNRIFWHIIIKPKISISTAVMYRRIDRLPLSDLRSRNLATSEVRKVISEKKYYNIFEQVLGREAVYINRIKSLLSGLGVSHSLLCGSGSSVFCTFTDLKDARKIYRCMSGHKDMEIFLVRTYKGGIYGNNRG